MQLHNDGSLQQCDMVCFLQSDPDGIDEEMGPAEKTGSVVFSRVSRARSWDVAWQERSGKVSSKNSWRLWRQSLLQCTRSPVAVAHFQGHWERGIVTFRSNITSLPLCVSISIIINKCCLYWRAQCYCNCYDAYHFFLRGSWHPKHFQKWKDGWRWEWQPGYLNQSTKPHWDCWTSNSFWAVKRIVLQNCFLLIYWNPPVHWHHIGIKSVMVFPPWKFVRIALTRQKS